MIRLLLLILLFTCPLQAKQYYLSICALFRDESRFLKEWIEYHHMLGVEHFYLFNHLSEDGYLEVLEPYIDSGLVELYDWPVHAEGQKDFNDNVQMAIYRKILNEKQNETLWLALIDTDEFLVPKQHPNLPSFLRDYEQYGGVVINWQTFGTSDVEKVPKDRLMVEMLTKKGPPEDGLNTCVKSIVIPSRVDTIYTPHIAVYHPPYFHVTEKGKRTGREVTTKKVSTKKIQLNHYSFRDEYFYYTEKARRLANWFGKEKVTPYPIYNTVTDTSIQRFVPELRKRLFDHDATLAPHASLHLPLAS